MRRPPRTTRRPDAALGGSALLAGGDHVLPEAVQAVFPAIASHRLISLLGVAGTEIAGQLLAGVAIP